MERAITASEANQHFSEMLREVQEGKSFVVTSRGRPVARVGPPDDLDEQSRKVGELLTWLGDLPVRDTGPWTREDLYEAEQDLST